MSQAVLICNSPSEKTSIKSCTNFTKESTEEFEITQRGVTKLRLHHSKTVLDVSHLRNVFSLMKAPLHNGNHSKKLFLCISKMQSFLRKAPIAFLRKPSHKNQKNFSEFSPTHSPYPPLPVRI